MTPEDQKDIINKVKSSGKNDEPSDDTEDMDTETDPNTEHNEAPASSGGADNGSAAGGGAAEASAGGDAGTSVAEDVKKKDEPFLIKPKKLSIFAPEGSEEAKYNIKAKLDETFNQDTMTQPEVAPVVKPAPTKTPQPQTQPSRKNKPFLPRPNVQPNPKATEENASTKEAEPQAKGSDVNTLAMELASMCKNVKDLLAKQMTFIKQKGVKNPEEVTQIINQASNFINNR